MFSSKNEVAMASPAPAVQVSMLPPLPFQTIAFPESNIGKTEVVWRPFQPTRHKRWPFLHYDDFNDDTYCHICLMALRQKRMKEHQTQTEIHHLFRESLTHSCCAEYVWMGSSNWINVTCMFKRHEQSSVIVRRYKLLFFVIAIRDVG